MEEMNKRPELVAGEVLNTEVLHTAVPASRSQFKSLLLANPNYFGTMPDIGFAPVEPFSGNTTYEELECIGLNPQAERLEAVVNIKRPFGYGTGPCDNGSTEYVRFWVKHGAVWHDLGTVTFTAYNLAGSAFPVSYEVNMPLDEARKFCTNENLLTVRGILSWEQEPTNPNFVPAWGNVMDVTVQIAPLAISHLPLLELLKYKYIDIKPELLEQVDLDQKLVGSLPPAPPTFATLKQIYAGKDVPGHRFGFKSAKALLEKPLVKDVFAHLPQKKAAAQDLSFVADDLVIGPELSEIIKAIDFTIGNTTFEELTCVGYSPETRTVGAVVKIKRNSGYSGDLCSPGSTEYVSFWAFYNGAWQALGGSQVNVHDLTNIGSGVHYAVFRSVNIPEHICAGLQSIPLRAILSWETPPTGPNYVPTWGNVVNTHIQPTIGDPGTTYEPRLLRIGRVTTNGIIQAGVNAGLADNGGAIYVSGDCLGNLSPFGGTVFIEGRFVNPPDVFDPNTGDVVGPNRLLYQVFYKRAGTLDAPTQLKNQFSIGVDTKNGFLPVTKQQQALPFGGDEYYTYMEGPFQAMTRRVLAVWQAGGLDDGNYEIELRGFFWNGIVAAPVGTQTRIVRIFNGYPHNELVVGGGTQPFKRPELFLSIDGGECGDITVGTIVTGKLRVNDRYLSHLGMFVQPIIVGGVPQPINPVTIKDGAVVKPNPIFYPTINTNGTITEWNWELNTVGMTPCGYTIKLYAWDRALVNDSCSGHYNEVAVGFCLEEPVIG